MQNEKWGIYIHVPWCRKKCIYCDFYSIAGDPDDFAFVNGIIDEFEKRRLYYPKNSAVSLYFGGGTPSLLSIESFNKIINYLYIKKSISVDTEITLEANPENINLNYANEIAKVGFNRVSLGIQSFNDLILSSLSRTHDSVTVRDSIINLRKTKINNISIDLIIGVPTENIKNIKNGLIFADKNGINHISIYMLNFKRKINIFLKNKKTSYFHINDDYQADVYNKIRRFLYKLKFEQYEISNFAKNKKYSEHNNLYWSSMSYMGLGPGAHSMRIKNNGELERRSNIKNFDIWKNKSSYFVEKLSNLNGLIEGLAFGIRNIKYGIDTIKLSKLYNCNIPDKFYIIMKDFNKIKFIMQYDNCFKLTQNGVLFADMVSREILSLSIDKSN